MFEHCAFREGPHRAHLGTPWGLWHQLAPHGAGVPNVVPHGLWHHMGRPMWCHTACGTTWVWGPQCGATRPVAPHATPNLVPHSLWGNGKVGKWGERQTSKWGHGEMKNWGTGERHGEKVEWGNGAIGSWHSPFGTDRKQHRNHHARMHIHRKSLFKFWGLWVQPPN